MCKSMFMYMVHYHCALPLQLQCAMRSGYFGRDHTSFKLTSLSGYSTGTNTSTARIAPRAVPTAWSHHCPPNAYISAGYPRMVRADTYEAMIDRATGINLESKNKKVYILKKSYRQHSHPLLCL